MATVPLVQIGRQYFVDPASFRQKHAHPWLLWRPPNEVSQRRIHVTDVSGTREPDFETGDAVAIEVLKAATNKFPFGITIGHAESNDIVIRHQQVSRFHAYIQTANGKHVLVDADSKNGTVLDGVRLEPSKPALLSPRATIALGSVILDYFEPEAFARWLDVESGGE